MAQKIRVKTTEKAFTFKLAGGEDDQIIEPSAVEAIDENGQYLLVIDDKAEPDSPLNLRIVSAADAALIRPFVIHGAPDKPKWEAVTKDADGFFYLIGSHAAKDDDTEKKLAKRSHLYRFRLKMHEDASKIEVDEETLSEFDIKPSLKKLKVYTDKPSEKNVKIEGLALKTIGGKKHLLFGLREPSALIEVYFAPLPPEAEIAEDSIIELSLEPYFRFAADTTINKIPFKLSSIEYVADWNGFLILTSSETTEKAANGEDQPVFHGNALWFVGDEQISAAQAEKVVESQKIFDFELTMKAEGFCLVPAADKALVRLAVVFDNDTEDLKKAGADKILLGMMQFFELSHEAAEFEM